VRKYFTRTALIAAALTLSGLIACQTTKEQSKFGPGALPSAKAGVVPRLNASTYLAHGHLLERQGNFEPAVRQYREALRLVPEMIGARNRLGITLNKLGSHAEASREFRATLQRAPGSAHLHNNLGFSLYLEGKYEQAEQALAHAVELQPEFRRAHMNHGLVLAKLGHAGQALAAFSLAGSRADAHYNLAVVQTETGHYIDAAHSLERALELNPQLTAARQRLREISRLAAAEEEQRAALAKAAAEEADARRLAAQESEEEILVANELEVAVADDEPGVLEIAPGPEVPSAIESAPEPDPPPVAQSDGSQVRKLELIERKEIDPAELANIQAQIQTLLVAAQQAWSPAESDPGRLQQVAAMFDGVVDALILDAPWRDESMGRLRETLGLSVEWF